MEVYSTILFPFMCMQVVVILPTSPFRDHHYTKRYKRQKIQCTRTSIADIKPSPKAGIDAVMKHIATPRHVKHARLSTPSPAVETSDRWARPGRETCQRLGGSFRGAVPLSRCQIWHGRCSTSSTLQAGPQAACCFALCETGSIVLGAVVYH